jgi:uncharacterized membrane protein
MEPVAMAVIAMVIIALPVVLLFLLVGRDRSDSRGNRVDRRWYVRPRAQRR